MKRLLAIDIGNTNISIGIFKNSRLTKTYSLPTKRTDYKKYFTKILLENKINDIIICSVVPKTTKLLSRYVSELLGKPAYIIGKQPRVPIKNLYRKPKEVGSDRLVNAFAGVKLYGSPLIIIDFGTAVTFDVISRKTQYLGGMILPGLNMSLRALHNNTALLPTTVLKRPKEFIGRDTENSILSGIVYGFTALIDNLTTRIRKRIGKNAKIIATGGNADFIGRFFRRFNKIDKNLTLKGLYFIYKLMQESEVKK